MTRRSDVDKLKNGDDFTQIRVLKEDRDRLEQLKNYPIEYLYKVFHRLLAGEL